MKALIFFVFSLSIANAGAAFKIAVSDQVVGHKYDSTESSNRRSFIGLNLSREHLRRKCVEPKFELDQASGEMVAVIEIKNLASSWYTPGNIYYKISIHENYDNHYTIRTTIKNSGTTVTSTSFYNPTRSYLETTFGTTYEAKLHGENVDRISITPALVISSCE